MKKELWNDGRLNLTLRLRQRDGEYARLMVFGSLTKPARDECF